LLFGSLDAPAAGAVACFVLGATEEQVSASIASEMMRRVHEIIILKMLTSSVSVLVGHGPCGSIRNTLLDKLFNILTVVCNQNK